jgi:Flp pilus assembly protein TadG
MRICYVLLSPTFGMHQYTADLANDRAVSDCVHVLTVRTTPRDRFAPQINVQAIADVDGPGLKLSNFNLVNLFKFYRAIVRTQPDVVHFTAPHLWNPVLLALLKRAGIPTIHTIGQRPAPDRSESGQALVEFALVLLFIILPFTFVLVDGSLTLFTLANVTNAAREAARAGSIYQCGSASIACSVAATQTFANQIATVDNARQTYIQNEIQQRLGPLVAFSQCTTTINYSPTTPDVGNPYRELDSMTVRLACPRRLLFGLVSTSSVTLTSESMMRIEPGGVAPAP